MKFCILITATLLLFSCNKGLKSDTNNQSGQLGNNQLPSGENSDFKFIASCTNSEEFKCVELYVSSTLTEQVINQNKNDIQSDNDCVLKNEKCSLNNADFSCMSPALHGLKINFVYYNGIETTVDEHYRPGLKQELCPLGYQEH